VFLGAPGARAVDTVTLSISPPAPRVNDVVIVTATGTAESDGTLASYYAENDADCARTQEDQAVRPGIFGLPLRSTSGGAFFFENPFQPHKAATYRVCAYLYYAGDNAGARPPRAFASATIPVALPLPPDRDADGRPDAEDACPDQPAGTPTGCPQPAQDADVDGVPDARDRCPNLSAMTPTGCPAPLPPIVSIKRLRVRDAPFRLRAQCNQPCELSLRGRLGGLALAGPRMRSGLAPAVMTASLSRGDLERARRLLRRRPHLDGTVTVTARLADGSTQVSTRRFKVFR